MIESPIQALYRRLFKPALWHRMDAGRRALPDFLVIGAMRSGTTSLHHQLAQHPAVIPGIKKEVHFFDLEFDRGERWYRAHFPHTAALQESGRLTGEASPYYLSHPLAAQRAAQIVPGARLIVVLRNPVDRAYSHYWHSVRLKAETLSFDAALEAEAGRLAGEVEKLIDRPGYRSFAYQHQAYVERSLYANELARWLAHFPQEQVLILSREAFSGDTEKQSNRLYAFLGLEPVSFGRQARLNEARYPDMAPETRKKLLAHFQPHNRRLFDLIGETFDWSN